jgi:polar amino acid transport system substrate-binding protein
MKILMVKLSSYLLVSALLYAPLGWAKTVNAITYHTHPPFIYEGQGLSYDLVELLNTLAPETYDFNLKAMSRPALNKLVAGDSVNLVPWVNPAWFGDELQTKQLWLDMSLMEDGNEVISSVQQSLDYNGPESLDGKVFGGLKGHRYQGIDDRIAELGKTRRVNSNNHLDNFRKLSKGRIDVTLVPRSAALFLIAQEGLSDQIYLSPKPHSRYQRLAFVTGPGNDLQHFLNAQLARPEVLARWLNLRQKYHIGLR